MRHARILLRYGKITRKCRRRHGGASALSYIIPDLMLKRAPISYSVSISHAPRLPWQPPSDPTRSATSIESVQVRLVELGEARDALIEVHDVSDLHGMDRPGADFGLHKVGLIGHVRTLDHKLRELHPDEELVRECRTR